MKFQIAGFVATVRTRDGEQKPRHSEIEKRIIADPFFCGFPNQTKDLGSKKILISILAALELLMIQFRARLKQ